MILDSPKQNGHPMSKNAEMKPDEILQKLEEIAEQIQLRVHYEEMKAFEFNVQDGGCKIKGENHVFIDRKQSTREKIEVLSKELKECNLEGIYIHPYIRERVLRLDQNNTTGDYE